MCGLEYFAHPWEFGPRKAKELLLTGDSVSARQAYELGMVSRVVDDGDLRASTLEFAKRIAALPSVTSLMIKESVNQSVDAMGFLTSLNGAFALHQAAHAHWAEVTHGAAAMATEEYGMPGRWGRPPIRPLEMGIPHA
jgi:enoyl-CoA hydratase